jgi:tetratricopeptide (TPR) repeat protein
LGAAVGTAICVGCDTARTPQPVSSDVGDTSELINPSADVTRNGDSIDSLAKSREAIRLKPASAAVHSDIGLALVRQGKFKEGIAEYRTAIRLQPDIAEPHYNLGMALQFEGELDEAAAEFRAAIKLKPNDDEAYYRLGLLFVAAEKPEEAISAYREAIRINPDRELAWSALARLLVFSPNRSRRDYEEAVVHSKKVIKLSPESSYTYETLALAEYRLGHWAESLAASERSLTLSDGGVASDWLIMAIAHWQNGEKEQGKVWFDKAMAWINEKGHVEQPLMRKLRTEAAALLGRPDVAATGADLPTAPTPGKPH